MLDKGVVPAKYSVFSERNNWPPATVKRKSPFKRVTSRIAHLEKLSLNFLTFVDCNPSQSPQILTILVPFWFIITPLGFF